MQRPEHVDSLLQALERIDEAMTDNILRSKAIQRRARNLHRQLEKGRSVNEAVGAEEQPRIVELLTANMTTLETAGAEFRAVEAQSLRADGLTIEAVAELFGVSRQRISALLKQRAAKTSH